MPFTTEKRPCPSCGKAISPRAKQCKHCLQYVPAIQTAGITAQSPHPEPGVHRPLASSQTNVERQASTQITSPVNALGAAVISSKAIKRYRDAYAIARNIDDQGQTMKSLALVAAVVIGVVTFVVAVVAGQKAGELAFAALIFGGIAAIAVWSVIYGHGVRIAAEGQHLMAALDVAVHTSPFMSDAERGEAMGM